MKKRLTNIFKPKSIIDAYFGEMGVVYDKIDGCYYLDKDIELEAIPTSVILYISSADKRSGQRQAFEAIRQEFSKIWLRVAAFLTHNEKIITEEQLRKQYRLESFTLPLDMKMDNMGWEIALLNLEDGFSAIIIEMRGFEPVSCSVEA